MGRTLSIWLATGAFCAAVLRPSVLPACGWWGDGEVNRDNADRLSVATGGVIDPHLSAEAAKLPGPMGYGIAVPDPGRAVPYLHETNGRAVTRISELRRYGFAAVIDLSSDAAHIRQHRAETQATGMRYISLAVNGDMPEKAQIKQFRETLLDTANQPLLVYSPRADLLGVIWASYRLGLGAPVTFSLSEGQALGMTPEQATALQILFQAAK